VKQGSRNFFFEKKKQKIFICFPAGDIETSHLKTNKSFWGAFFQEGAACLKLSRA
jgi:hypothetical protein